jgi:hypothetical protein
MRYWPCPKFLRLKRTDLHVVKTGHPGRRNFGRLLVAYGPWRVLFVSLEHVFEFSAIISVIIGIGTAQPQVPRAPKLKQTGGW